jgi:hypothetical protein
MATRFTRPVLCQNPFITADVPLSCLLCVLGDEAAGHLPALGPGGDIGAPAGPPRRLLLRALVWAMAVVVAGELG